MLDPNWFLILYLAVAVIFVAGAVIFDLIIWFLFREKIRKLSFFMRLIIFITFGILGGIYGYPIFQVVVSTVYKFI
jgi:hypothetical protein